LADFFKEKTLNIRKIEVKNMIGRRGQGAMEYLMTYGWAILVVMIVGIVMWQLGIFNMGGTTVTATGFAKIKPQLAATGFDHTGEPKIVFTNGVGTTIKMLSGKIIDDGQQASSCTLGSNMFKPQTIGAGANARLSTPGTNCIRSGTPGDVYNARVTLTYEVAIGGISSTHSESGSIRGPYE
jgi:hypothetical protein